MLAINYWFKFVVILLVIIFFGQSESSQFEDLRCKCTCLSYPKYNISAQVLTAYWYTPEVLKLSKHDISKTCRGSLFLGHFILQWIVYFKADKNSPKCHLQCRHVLTLTQVSGLRIDILGNSCMPL